MYVYVESADKAALVDPDNATDNDLFIGGFGSVQPNKMAVTRNKLLILVCIIIVLFKNIRLHYKVILIETIILLLL